MADEFASIIDTAVQEKKIYGGAAIAVSSKGETIITKAFGNTSVDDDAAPWAFDSTFRIASSTKLLTAISVLQCVSKGLLKLDEDVGAVLPEFANAQILTGFDEDGKPQFKPAENPPTLRHLLTHTAGLPYYGMGNPLVHQYRDSLKLPNFTGTFADYTQPIVSEPGEKWEYGSGVDWAGRCVEKVTGLRLGEYMQKHIFEPLGMVHTAFRVTGNEAILSRAIGRVARDEQGVLVKDTSTTFSVQHDQEDDLGGQGLCSTAQDYIKVLTSLLINDGKLLDGAMYEELFRARLGNSARQSIVGWFTNPIFGSVLAPGYPRPSDSEWNCAFGGAMVDHDIPGHAGKGTLFWSGFPNNYWFIDRKNGVCGFYASFILPYGDKITGEMFAALQRAAVKEGTKLGLNDHQPT